MSSAWPVPLLEDSVDAYLNGRGLNAGGPVTVTALTDGVSARVYRVDGTLAHWVVKQALPELRVSGTWTADPRRAVTEARALELVSRLTQNDVPELIDVDDELCALTMTAAPSSWTNWRSLLLSDGHDPRCSERRTAEIATSLGRTLGTWHRDTWGLAEIAQQFGDDDAFEQLRVTPFHRAIRSIHSELSARLDLLIADLTLRSECLVHGDFSPKNILIGDERQWVLDFEVARFGAAVFDVAFLAHHLALKAIARPQRSRSFAQAFALFLESYRSTVEHDPDLELLGWHSAALLLARVDGVSPAPYLSPEQRITARRAGLGTLSSTDGSNGEFWEIVLAAAEGGSQ